MGMRTRDVLLLNNTLKHVKNAVTGSRWWYPGVLHTESVKLMVAMVLLVEVLVVLVVTALPVMVKVMVKDVPRRDLRDRTPTP